MSIIELNTYIFIREACRREGEEEKYCRFQKCKLMLQQNIK